MKPILLLFILPLLTGCVALEPFSQDAESAKVEVAALIPEGTPLNEAKSRLEKMGLKCRVRNDMDATHTVYLYGSASRAAMPMIRRTWLIRYEVREDRVYAPYVGVELTGP